MARILKEDKSLNQEQLRILSRVSKDVFLFSTFVWVVNPVLGMVKFNLYPYQKSVLYQYNPKIQTSWNYRIDCYVLFMVSYVSPKQKNKHHINQGYYSKEGT